MEKRSAPSLEKIGHSASSTREASERVNVRTLRLPVACKEATMVEAVLVGAAVVQSAAALLVIGRWLSARKKRARRAKQ